MSRGTRIPSAGRSPSLSLGTEGKGLSLREFFYGMGETEERMRWLPSLPGNGTAGFSIDDYREIRAICGRLGSSSTKAELARAIASEVRRYAVFDLQVICGRLHHEIDLLPSPYREAVRPFFIEQLFGTHHHLLLVARGSGLARFEEPLADPGLFREYLAMVAEACFCREIQSDYIPDFNSPFQGLFYYLMAAFSMFVLGRPGHPPGMPFPGGFRVEDRDGTYYCPVRDKEREVKHSICNFCPAQQDEVR